MGSFTARLPVKDTQQAGTTSHVHSPAYEKPLRPPNRGMPFQGADCSHGEAPQVLVSDALKYFRNFLHVPSGASQAVYEKSMQHNGAAHSQTPVNLMRADPIDGKSMFIPVMLHPQLYSSDADGCTQIIGVDEDLQTYRHMAGMGWERQHAATASWPADSKILLDRMRQRCLQCPMGLNFPSSAVGHAQAEGSAALRGTLADVISDARAGRQCQHSTNQRIHSRDLWPTDDPGEDQHGTSLSTQLPIDSTPTEPCKVGRASPPLAARWLSDPLSASLWPHSLSSDLLHDSHFLATDAVYGLAAYGQQQVDHAAL
mmetsp:Transcript_22209/g.56923  ORF Transcript_22209/g.56923 Transcript_22209/m.56923 type:complete len:314 (-) Transcript_22209:111-1052(-)